MVASKNQGPDPTGTNMHIEAVQSLKSEDTWHVETGNEIRKVIHKVKKLLR